MIKTLVFKLLVSSEKGNKTLGLSLHIYLYYINICIYILGACTCDSVCVEVRRQFLEVSSLLLDGFEGSISDHQAGQQEP